MHNLIIAGVGGIAGGSDPILTDGRIHFNYTGDVCEKNPKTRYNIQIILICDYSTQIKEPITNNEYVSYERLTTLARQYL